MGILSKLFSPKESGYSFTLESHFKGFKAFPMVVHGNQEAEKNNKYFKDADMSGKTILFKDEDPERIGIYIDNRKVGTLFDEDCIKKVRTGAFDKVYAKADTETVVEQKKTISRPRIKLFVHYKE